MGRLGGKGGLDCWASEGECAGPLEAEGPEESRLNRLRPVSSTRLMEQRAALALERYAASFHHLEDREIA